MKTTIALLVAGLLLVCAPAAVAQKVGTSSLQFLKVMPDARGTAMGDALASVASGANAVFWNPAGIAHADAIDVAGTTTMWLFDAQQHALAAAIPLDDWGTVAVQLQYVDYGSMPVTRADQLQFAGTGTNVRYNPGLTGETFNPSTYLIGVTYAKKMTDKFATGVTVKFINESLWSSSTVTYTSTSGVTETVNTFARLVLFDFGLQYNTGYRTVRVSAAVQNFGAQVKFAKEGFPAPLAFRIGTAADVVGPNGLLGESEDNRITMAYDLFQPNDYKQQMHLGMEYGFSDAVFLRAGYKFFYDNDGLTAGAGVRQEVGGFPLSLDYSYGSMGDYLPAVHRISVGVQLP
ncbi:MAG: PorV/PorQ family protein [Bacteroidetes bacterium]|jgi:hypothetical protein|nr:PorV/PorQ family protein [Bacteroidota bacterium]